VRTALDRAAARIEGKFKQQPLVEASIRQTIGNTYKELGQHPEAQRQLERALDLRYRVLGEQHPDTLDTMNDLAMLHWYRGQYRQAEPPSIKVLELRRRVLGERHPDTLNSMSNLALLYGQEGKYAQAEPLSTKVLEIRQRVLGEEHPDTLTSMHGLATLEQVLCRFSMESFRSIITVHQAGLRLHQSPG
jgi:tetratricopeptide (TPR) repeat protein